MYLQDLEQYVADRTNNGLTKFEVKTENDGAGHFFVVKTKEEYIFLDEDEADSLINEARQDRQFISAKKTYKAGKISKSGEIKSPECWKVVVEFSR